MVTYKFGSHSSAIGRKGVNGGSHKSLVYHTDFFIDNIASYIIYAFLAADTLLRILIAACLFSDLNRLPL